MGEYFKRLRESVSDWLCKYDKAIFFGGFKLVAGLYAIDNLIEGNLTEAGIGASCYVALDVSHTFDLEDDKLHTRNWLFDRHKTNKDRINLLENKLEE